MKPAFGIGVTLGALAALVLMTPTFAIAHCDGMDGPVVKAAQKALASGDVKPVLAWVQPADEAAIREAFEQTRAVRKLNRDARELADRYFFETLVRVHRAGEGAPYTGLKPAGRDLGPAIPLADQALETKSLDPLLVLLTDEVRHGVTSRFEAALEAGRAASTSVEAGRHYVHAYVDFIHYVERAHEAATRSVDGHFGEGEAEAEAEGHGHAE